MLNRLSLLGLTAVCLSLSCSKPTNPSQTKIIGGTKVENGYPFFAALTPSHAEYVGCGGAFIAPNVVVTAAHCVEDAFSAHFVIQDVTRTDEMDPALARKVNSIAIHPGYDERAGNDIALLFLEPTMQDVPVIEINRSGAVPVARQPFRVIGFGNRTSLGGIDDPAMYEVDVPYIAMEACRSLSDDYYATIGDGFLCGGVLGKGGKDSCQGDSGGPAFTMDAEGRATLVGVVSQGPGCAQPDSPGLYSLISHYASWIDESIRLHDQAPVNLKPDDIARIVRQDCYLKQMTNEFVTDGTSTLGLSHNFNYGS
ncbi:MAG: serine protease, partial [Pseudobdellovibrionaceae bacterium]|nr:serine protease [Pseudobdellovibrionaceae bacterium]